LNQIATVAVLPPRRGSLEHARVKSSHAAIVANPYRVQLSTSLAELTVDSDVEQLIVDITVSVARIQLNRRARQAANCISM